jgi:hypothetical protein
MMFLILIIYLDFFYMHFIEVFIAVLSQQQIGLLPNESKAVKISV